MGPETICSMVRVCSHGFISSSHALTSDWRADDMDCITPSMRDLIYGHIFLLSKTIQMYNNSEGPWDHSTRLASLIRFVDHISNI